MHLPRVPDKYLNNILEIETPKVIHFQFIDLDRCKAKQRYYQVLDKTINRVTNDFKNNFIYGVTKQKPKLLITPEEWIKEYSRKGINFNIKKQTNTYWNKEIISLFKKYNVKKFKWLDIWDIDWQKEAEKINLPNTNKEKIFDPRNIIIKIYHKLQRTSLINIYVRNIVLYIFNIIKISKK